MSKDSLIQDQAFAAVADDLAAEGFSVRDDLIPNAILSPLAKHLRSLPESAFQAAGIGRQQNFGQDASVRNDRIRWLDQSHPAEAAWLEVMAYLQQFLNRQLFLGLFSYESHVARYAPGARYQKHVDAFRGEANRILSTVLYLNEDWPASNGGDLLLYAPDQPEQVLRRIPPEFGRMCIFLSEEFPHEVLPASHSRWSIAGWFRLNASSGRRIDPPE